MIQTITAQSYCFQQWFNQLLAIQLTFPPSRQSLLGVINKGVENGVFVLHKQQTFCFFLFNVFAAVLKVHMCFSVFAESL